MKKFKLYFDKEEEEQWLNEMCGNGWDMTGFFMGVYQFKPCSPGKYIYQVDLPDIKGGMGEWDRKKRAYIDFVEGTGAEFVCSWGFYLIFRKEADQGEFKLYTDAESKMKLYQRIRCLLLGVGLFELWLSIFQTWNYLNFKAHVSSPGLNLVMLCCLLLVYAMTGTMFTMVVKITKKIRRFQ